MSDVKVNWKNDSSAELILSEVVDLSDVQEVQLYSTGLMQQYILNDGTDAPLAASIGHGRGDLFNRWHDPAFFDVEIVMPGVESVSLTGRAITSKEYLNQPQQDETRKESRCCG